MKDGPDLSVVIVAFEVLPLLERCLASIPAAAGGLSRETIVVDNGRGGDGTWAWLAGRSDLRALRGSSLIGFGSAVNLGVRPARGRYLLVLNPDTILPPGSLPALVDRLEADRSIGVIGPKLVLASGRMDLSARRGSPTPVRAFYHLLRLPRLFPRLRFLGGYNLRYLDPDVSCDVDSISGAFMLVRSELFRDLGGFDEDFWMYGEDLDLCQRAKAAGFRVVYEPAVLVLHAKGSSSRSRRPRTRYEFFRSMALFYRKHQAPSNTPLVNLAVYAAIFVLGAGSVGRAMLAVLAKAVRHRG